MNNVWLHNMLARIATAKEVIEATPPELHAKILKSVENGALHYSIDEEPAAQPEADVSASFREQIERAFREQFRSSHVRSRRFAERRAVDRAAFWRSMARYQAVDFTPKIRTPLNSWRARPMLIFPFRFKAEAGSTLWCCNGGSNAPAWPLLVQFATMAAISAIGIVAVLGRLTRPLKKLAKAASALGRGETSAKLDEEGPREVVETIHAFNEMQERLTTFVYDRAKMLAALGHDLRTPITSFGSAPNSSRTTMSGSKSCKRSTKWQKWPRRRFRSPARRRLKSIRGSWT